MARLVKLSADRQDDANGMPGTRDVILCQCGNAHAAICSDVGAGDRDRQMVDRPKAGAPAPFDLGFIYDQREFRPAPEQSLQCAYALKARNDIELGGVRLRKGDKKITDSGSVRA
jgi:hypothetical protein